MLHTSWVLVLACLYGSLVICLAYNRRELSNDGVEYYGDDNMVEEAERSSIYRDVSGTRFKRDSDEPAEYVWDWGHFKLKNEVDKRSQIQTPPAAKNVAQSGQRKTIIPLEGIVFAKIKNNHLVKPKLSARLFAPRHKYKSRIPIKRGRLGTLARRFDLYPRWFSNSIPTLFGKHFARRYYKPYGSIQSVRGQARHHINGRRKKAHLRSGTVFHELPMSWMTGDSRDEIPKQNRGESMYNYGGYDVKNFDETKLEGMESDDSLVMNPQSASRGRHVSDIADKKSLPFLKDIPHEIMAQLNPYEYTVVPEHGGARRSHHLTHGRLHPHSLEHGSHVIGHLESSRELDSQPSHEAWTDYHSLPQQHHHRRKLNPCYHNPCLNHGRCHYNNGNFRCQCKRGFNGEICDRTRFSCHPNPCYNGGTCTVLQTGYFCTCPQGFRGHDCDGQNPCASNPCQNNGRCTDTADGYFCTCGKGYSGHSCGGVGSPTTRVEDMELGGTMIECPIGACLNGGTCVKMATHAICNCPPGHHGTRCEDKRHGHGGHGHGEHGVVLTGASAGTPVTSLPMNDIHSPYQHVHNIPVSNTGCSLNCKNGGKCTHSISGSVGCSCPVGYNGELCEAMLPSEHNDGHNDGVQIASHGVSCDPDMCKNGGTCMKSSLGSVNTHVCSCPVGFQGSDCGNADLCTPNPCENGGSCVQEGEENYKCVCLGGYKGLDCNLANHCTKDTCKNNGVCEETPDSFHCKCGTGFRGGDCTQASACQVNPCSHQGVCVDKGADFVCNCSPGYAGTTCDAKDACYPNPCANGICRDEQGVGTCNCTHGWSGHLCDNADFCSSTPCLNGGSCEHERGTGRCLCAPGFQGTQCERTDICASDPCLNGGSCEQAGENVKCLCAPGFQGTHCEQTDPCYADPCENSGQCDRAGTTFVCKCANGFHGERCHLKAHCQPSPCNSHGECFESDEGFICECNPRYMGRFCEVRRHCYGNPCQSGYCTESNGTYDCKCPFSYFGRNCEMNVCDSHPCLNGGTCIPAENDVGYGCECVFPYHGVTCGEMDPCLTNPCRNGGTCQSQLQGGLLTGLNHMSVFGPYECGPYDTDNHCGPMTGAHHHHDSFGGHDGHHEEAKSPYSSYEAKGIESKPDVYKSAYGNGALDNDKDMGRFDKDKDMSQYDKDKDTGRFDKDKDMNQFNKDSNMDTDKDKDGRFDKGKSVFDTSKETGKDRYQSYKDNDAGSNKPQSSQSYYSDKDRNRGDSSKEVGSNDSEKDGRISSFASPGKGGQASAEKGGGLDEGKDQFGDSGKDSWPIEAKNDHAGLLNKVDYYPKHQPEPSGEKESEGLPECPCTPQPCAWPPVCRPQQCTPPCKRHFDENEQRHFEETYHKRTIKSPYNNSQDAQARTLPRGNIKNIYAKTLNTPPQNKTVVKRDTENRNNDMTKLSIKEILALKRDVIIDVKASKRLEIIPKVIINFRHPGQTDVYKRTMHELYVCQCPPGYLGAHCQHMNPCRASPCTNGGSCIPRGDRYICQCLAGYGGRHCDDPHPCTPNPCTHGGRCHLAKSVRGYECRCKSGWRGYNCEDRDNCALSNPCRHDGNCINVDGADGGIECKCRTRYSGKHCEIDTCAACDMNAYCHHGNCVCEAGYFGNGFRCKAMTDICTPNPCDNKGECKPGLDGKLFSCECQSGYVGTRCELPHPCANNPCLHNGACVDESNSKDRGILLLDRNDYKCFCSSGYKGKNCGETSLAACSSGPCQHNGTCFDSSSESHSKHLTHSEDYECFCAMGFTGKNCETNHFACYSYPCMNGGTCLDSESLPDINFDAHGYKCNCNHGFIGRNCEVTVYGPGACHQSPCLNSGRCLDAMNSNDPDIHFDYEHQFKCICAAQYSGKICEVPYPACFSNPCHNKGLCSDRSKEPGGTFDENGYTCTCLAGYDGRNCERQNSLAIAEDIDTDHLHDLALEGKSEGRADEDLHDDVSRPLEGKKDDASDLESKLKLHGDSLASEIGSKPKLQVASDLESKLKQHDLESKLKQHGTQSTGSPRFAGTSTNGGKGATLFDDNELQERLSYPSVAYGKKLQRSLQFPFLNPRPSPVHRNIGDMSRYDTDR